MILMMNIVDVECPFVLNGKHCKVIELFGLSGAAVMRDNFGFVLLKNWMDTARAERSTMW